MKRLLQKGLIILITFYQKTLSPDHGWWAYRYPYGCCRYHPTCSNYAKQAIEIYGPGRGMFIAVRRLIRCHPFTKGGIDPVA